MTEAGSGWRIAFEAPTAAVPALEAAMAPFCTSVAWFEVGQGRWTLEGFAPARPDPTALALALAIASAADGVPPPLPTVEALPPRDWVAETARGFPPVTIGRFFIAGSVSAAPVPVGRLALRLDAGSAFGSGRHGSTAGCLLAIDQLRRRPRRALDIGTGSGILAIAVARRFAVPVVAVDVDPRAIAVAAENVCANGVAALVRTTVAEDYRSPLVRSRGPYDLIVCNILARSVRRMAGALAEHLAPGGTAVLSGFLAADAPGVSGAHRRRGLRLVQRIAIDGWQTLVLGGRQPA